MSGWDYDKICKYIEDQGEKADPRMFELDFDEYGTGRITAWKYAFKKPTKTALKSYTKEQMQTYKTESRDAALEAKYKDLIAVLDRRYRKI